MRRGRASNADGLARTPRASLLRGTVCAIDASSKIIVRVASQRRSGYRILYRLRLAPWESKGLPAELADLHPAGRALELGCGRGN